jgi:hypothetical protein
LRLAKDLQAFAISTLQEPSEVFVVLLGFSRRLAGGPVGLFRRAVQFSELWGRWGIPARENI